MGDVIKLNIAKQRKQKTQQKAKGETLCRNGFHKWQIVQEKQFDVKTGKLVTVFKCQRCDIRKTELL